MDTLEGFTADAKLLGSKETRKDLYDKEFYQLCVLDNCYIFELKDSEAWKIPKMKMSDLERILNKEMKLTKACDVYHLTVEHLRYAGHQAQLVLLRLLNEIISNI